MSKKFSWSALFTSKTIWFNVIMTVLGVVAVLQGMTMFVKYAQILILISAVGNVILKVWFNNQAIASAPSGC